MQDRHVPVLGPRFWAVLCCASIFGANMGDFFARVLHLGHFKGLPFLAVALAVVLVAERYDRRIHEGWYWAAIIVVRTAATNLADLFCGDFRIPRLLASAALGVLLALAVLWTWNRWKERAQDTRDPKGAVLTTDGVYWLCMLLAGTLGTVIGDYFSHDLHLGDGRASIVLSLVLVAFFVVGARGWLWLPGYYWVTVVMVRSAGTAVGDYFAQRDILGLQLSTAATGIVFLLLVLFTRSRAREISSSTN